MCGSFNNNFDNFNVKGFMNDIICSYSDRTIKLGDMFPGYNVPILTVNHDTIHPLVLRWGYDGFDKNKLIYNARSESVIEKPYFSKDFKSHRCVVPVVGFYEWSKDKTKYFYKAENNSPLYLGGFYNIDKHQSFVILTQEAIYPVNIIHHRSPIVLDKTQIKDFILGSKQFVNIDTPKLVCSDTSHHL